MSNSFFEKYQLQDGDNEAYQSLFDLQQNGKYMGFNVKNMNAEQLELFGKFLEQYHSAGSQSPAALFTDEFDDR